MRTIDELARLVMQAVGFKGNLERMILSQAGLGRPAS